MGLEFPEALQGCACNTHGDRCKRPAPRNSFPSRSLLINRNNLKKGVAFVRILVLS